MKRIWTVALSASVAGTVLWWLHAVFNYLFPPFDNAFDIVLWVVCSVLKVVCVLSIPFVLSRVFQSCRRDFGKTAKAVLVWATTAVVFLVVLSVFRDPLARFLNGDGARFFPTSIQQIGQGQYNGDETSFLVAWQSGVIFLTELGLVLFSVLSLGVFAFFGAKNGQISGGIATGWLWLIAWGGGLGTHLLVWDYDLFFAGSLVGPLTMDVISPTAMSAASEIGFLVYLTIIWSSWLLDRYVLTREEKRA